MKETHERKMHVAMMRMSRWICGNTKMDKIRNNFIKRNLYIVPVSYREA